MMKAVSHLSWAMFLPSHNALNFSTGAPITRSTTDLEYLKAPAAVCSDVRANNLSMSVLRLEVGNSALSVSSLSDEDDLPLDLEQSSFMLFFFFLLLGGAIPALDIDRR